MFRDTPYAPSRGSFQTPVIPPNVDPDAAPFKSFNINCQWLPYIRGALMQLLLQATWKTDDPAVRLLAQQRAATLIALFEECSTADFSFSCNVDLGFDPSPFGTWSIRCGGNWVGFSGYEGTINTVGGICSPNGYFGVFLDVVLDNPQFITNLSLEYDYSTGQVGFTGDPSGVHVFDVTNGVTVGVPLDIGSVPNGSGLVYNSGAFSAVCDHFWVIVESANNNTGVPSPTGAVLLRQVTLQGHSANPPC